MMAIRSLRTLLGIVILCYAAVSPLCGQPENPAKACRAGTDLKFRVETAPEWTAYFDRDSGWIGGDGLFSIPLNGVDTPGTYRHTETLLVFSDSFWGGKMTNNVVAWLPAGAVRKSSIQFHSGYKPDGQRSAVFVPATPSAQEGQYYWLGDGFVNRDKGNTIYLFGYRMENTGAAVFGFKERGNALIAIGHGEDPPFKRHRQMEMPAPYSFGAGVLVNTDWSGVPHPDGYVYVYGVKGADKALLVARVKAREFEDFEKWRYWDGTDWSEDIRHVKSVTKGVSNELSVTPLPDGRYALIFQKNGIDPVIGMRIGSSPVGPFGQMIPLYTCPEPAGKKTLFAYNAKAHPHLSDPGELLISYHVNSFDFLRDFHADPGVFTPRFIKLVFE